MEYLLVIGVSVIILIIIALILLNVYCSLMNAIRDLRRVQVTEQLTVSPEAVSVQNSTSPVQNLFSCSQPKGQSLRSRLDIPQMGSKFNRADITLHQLIKAGKEGMFYRANMMRGSIKGYDSFTCKISTSRNQKQIEKEISVMRKLGSHTKILQLVDWDISDTPYMLIMEDVNLGTLLNFLQENKNTLRKDNELQHCFTVVAYHIAHAMKHLCSKMIVHRNLGLRNILLHSFPNEVKVADFSLARDLTSSRCKKPYREWVPLRWCPPEYFKNKNYGFKGDVWEYGILLWEMQTFGSSVPYPHLNTSQDVAHYVCAGYRNYLPEECRPEMIQMMKDCWQESSSLRPSFMDIVRVLENILENDCDYVNMDPTESKDNDN